jgi:hypothetical protein
MRGAGTGDIALEFISQRTIYSNHLAAHRMIDLTV